MKRERFIILILAIAILTGCANGAGLSDRDGPSDDAGPSGILRPGALQARANIAAFEEDNRSAAERADALTRHITELDDIDRASVVITGNTAMVGIRLAEGLDDQKLLRLKARVEKEVKNLDPALSHVAVTAAPELVQRLNDLADSDADDTPPRLDPATKRVVETLTPPA